MQSWAQIGEDVAGNAIGQLVGEVALDVYRRQQGSRSSQSPASATYDPHNPLSANNTSGYQQMGTASNGVAALDAAWNGQAEAILASSPQVARQLGIGQRRVGSAKLRANARRGAGSPHCPAHSQTHFPIR